MKLEKLSKKQEQKLEETKQEWINHTLNSGYETDYNKLRPLIDWCYKKAGLQKPFIFIADGYYSQKIMINFVLEYFKNIIHGSVENQVGSQVRNQVRNQVENQVENQVRNQVWNQVWSQVRNQVWNQVENQVGSQVGSQELKFYEDGYGSWSFGWLSYYDYFEKVGIVKSEEFQKFRDMNKESWCFVFFECFIVACKFPIKVLRDDRERLHSVTQPAVQWRDNCNQYFIHGVGFEKEPWEKIVNRKLTPKQLFKIKNTDQRFVAINHYGFECVIDKLDKKLLDVGKYGNELFSTKFDQVELKFLTYPDIDDPTKQRISFVPPTFNKADEAMAWKHNCVVDEYYKMEVLQS